MSVRDVPSDAPQRAGLRRLAESVRNVLGGGRAGLDAFVRLVALRSEGKRRPAGVSARVRQAVEALWDQGQNEWFADPAAAAWLYQYWVNCDKTRVAAKLARKSGDKISGRDLVSATCIYTPRAMGRFLLENTLGAMWARGVLPEWRLLCGHRGAERKSVDDLTLLDPACGAGLILLEAFDLLYAMHREEFPGRSARDICRRILSRNLFGTDIDPYAIRIAKACLAVRCRRLDPSFVLGRMNIHCFEGSGREMGSLQRPPKGSKKVGSADRFLTRRYDAVVTNPPFVGFRKLGESVKAKLVKADPLAVSDLAVAFVSRCHSLLKEGGRMGIVAPSAWTMSAPAAPLRKRMLETGGPMVLAHLGQRVFDTAPLLFVSLAVVEKSAAAKELRVIRSGGGSDRALLSAIEGGGEVVKLAELRASVGARFATPVRSVSTRPTIPLGELFTFVDGVWSGNNARDVREASAVEVGDPEWVPASGGQGYRRWYAPIRRRVRATVVAGWPWIERRAGCLEYTRVAGGKLAARMVVGPSAAIAGVVTMVPKGKGRELDALAVMNSRAGTLFLRRLVSGLNFNPGYAALVPVPREPMGIGREVERAVEIVKELARLEEGCGDFGGFIGDEEGLRRELALLERQIDLRVREALGISERELDEVELPRVRKRGVREVGSRG